MPAGLSTSWPLFVDDTTASEIVYKGDVSNAQSIADQVILWSQENRRTNVKGSGFRLLVTPKSSMLLTLREKS